MQSSPDIFVPLSMQPLVDPKGKNASLLDDPDLWWVNIMGRIKPGISDAQAQAGLNVALEAAVRGTMAVKAGDTMLHLDLADGSRGLGYAARMFKKPVYVLMALTGFVLLLACAKIANLLLARGRSGKGDERPPCIGRGTRAGAAPVADGESSAGRDWRSGRPASRLPWPQYDSETDGECVGPGPVGCTDGLGRLRVRYGSDVVHRAGVRAGSAWLASRAEVSSSLKESTQTVSRRRKGLGGKAIVAFQIALSTLLVVGAGLFLRTLFALDSINVGFRTDHLVLFEVGSQAALWAWQGRATSSASGTGIRILPDVEGVDPGLDARILPTTWTTTTFTPRASPIRAITAEPKT